MSSFFNSLNFELAFAVIIRLLGSKTTLLFIDVLILLVLFSLLPDLPLNLFCLPLLSLFLKPPRLLESLSPLLFLFLPKRFDPSLFVLFFLLFFRASRLFFLFFFLSFLFSCLFFKKLLTLLLSDCSFSSFLFILIFATATFVCVNFAKLR